MKKRRKKAVEIQESINQVLFHDWDPIGVNDLAPDDEYNFYVGGIYRLLVSDAAEFKITEHLHQLEVTQMEVSSNREKLKDVAEKLMKLNVSL